MTSEEIKHALRHRQKILYEKHTYEYAQAWRVTFDQIRGEYISSLELVTRERNLIIARADKCELA